MSEVDFDAVQQAFNSVEFVQVEGYSYGQQLMGSCLFWVPRQVWSDKPEATSVIVAAEEGYTFKNLALPLWSELYIDGGIVFVAFVFFWYGFSLRNVEMR